MRTSQSTGGFVLSTLTVLGFVFFTAQRADSEGTDGEPITARYAQKYGDDYKKFSLYKTGNVNTDIKKLSSKERDVKTAASLKMHYESTNFNFACPGNSFISAVHSSYNNDHKNRTFSFVCAFLEDGKGELLKKTACVNAKTGYDLLENGTAKSTCDDKGFIAGIKSEKFFNGDLQEDRRYKTNCCHLQTFTKQDLQPVAASCQVFSYQARANIAMTCPEGMIVREMSSTFKGADSQDRSYNFTCCSAATAP